MHSKFIGQVADSGLVEAVIGISLDTMRREHVAALVFRETQTSLIDWVSLELIQRAMKIA